MTRDWWKAVGLAAGIALLVGPSVEAQQRGTIEVGALARVTRFDESNHLDPQVGGGGMLAVLIAENIAIELAASYGRSARTNSALDVSYLPVSLWLVRRDSLSPRTDLLYGAGLVRNEYGGDLDTHEFGASATVGARRLLTQWVALRGEGIVDFMSSPANGSPMDFNLSIQLGVSVQLNRVPPRDSDFDGVSDRFDRCPRTPGRTDVDRDGCPLPPDADLDGVPDAQDRCPGTTFGVTVDSAGCPRFREPPPHEGETAPSRRQELSLADPRLDDRRIDPNAPTREQAIRS